MGDAVLADEAGLARRVVDIDPHHARRQRRAHAGRGAVGEGHRDLGAPGFRCRLELVQLEDIALARGHVGDVQQADLLGLVVGDRHRLGQRIDVDVRQATRASRLGPAAARRGRRGIGPAARVIGRVQHRHVTRHHPRPRIAEGHARPVGQGHPAGQIQRPGRLVIAGDIVGLPRQPRGQIAEGHVPASRALGVQGHAQGRARAQIGRHLVEDHTGRHAVVAQHLDTAVHLKHHAFVGGQHTGAVGLLRAGAGIGADEADFAPDRSLHQPVRGQQVVVEILLDHRQAAPGQADRLGTDAGGDAGELPPRATGGDVQTAGVLHQGDVLVIDRQGHRVGSARPVLSLLRGDRTAAQQHQGRPGQ